VEAGRRKRLVELAEVLRASQYVVADTRSGERFGTNESLHPLLQQLMGTAEAVKQLDASIDGQELPALWGMGGDELVLCKPATHTLVACSFRSPKRSSSTDSQKEVAEKVQSAWSR
jgi:hypothetical protein